MDQHIPIGPQSSRQEQSSNLSSIVALSFSYSFAFRPFSVKWQRWQLLMAEVSVADADESKMARLRGLRALGALHVRTVHAQDGRRD